MTDLEKLRHPVQAQAVGSAPETLTLMAYEVYCEVYGPQPALVDAERGCRGGFSWGELTAFLYARAFPRDQWRQRVNEAVRP
jgi:hypothetical protein